MKNKLAELGRRFLSLFCRGRFDADLEEEMRLHQELREQEQVECGVSPEEAHYAAQRRFGNRLVLREESRDIWGWNWFETFLQDIRFGLRQLRRNPGFTAVAIITLALGIGANTAIFSMVNGIMLRALPYHQARQLYAINEEVPQFTAQSPWGALFPVNAGNFMRWQGQCPAISSMALVGPDTLNLTGKGNPRQVKAVRVSWNFFSVLGVRPQLGRDFLPGEDQHGRDHEVILGAPLWRQLFNSNPQVIGKSITLDNASYTVVGITPDSFRFPELPHFEGYTPELYKPVGFEPWMLWSGIGGFNFLVIARLKPGADAWQALAQINVVEARIARKGDARRNIAPGEVTLRAALTPLKTSIIGPAARAIWVLMAAAGFVLLIICVNLANLMLVRNIGRSREIAVRSALGATARRLLRQFFAEGLILSITGGGLGLLAAVMGIQILIRNAPLSIPRVAGIQIDARVLLFTMGASFFTALLFAVLPAFRATNVRPIEALKSGGPAASSARASVRLRSGLVVGEIALCAVLLTGALLLIESLLHVARANEWMDEEHVIAADISIPPSETRTNAQATEFLLKVVDNVRTIPGVRSAGFTSDLPLLGPGFSDDIDFQEAPHPADKHVIGQYRFVSPGYFEAIGLPLISGRFLSESDKGKDVAVISQKVAERLLPGRNPIGMHLLWDQLPPKRPREIIGEVGDVRDASDGSPTMAVYLPVWTFYQTAETLVVRTSVNTIAAAGSIRRAVWSIDPQVAIPRERTLKTIVSTSEATRRYETFLGAVFAGFALLLAAIGLYGVISYSVNQRMHEVGIRMALGAQKRDVLRLMLGQGILLALAGVGIGAAAALGLSRFLSGLLYGVKPTDPITYAAVSVILVSTALLACYIPARRATKVDPVVALRYE